MALAAGAWERYAEATRGEHFAYWAAEHCMQSTDRFAGLPLVLEGWQRDVMDEALAELGENQGYWQTVVLVVPKKNGKALSLDTPLPTLDGWTTMGDVAIGDELFDEHGQPCRVSYVLPIMLGNRCYRVTFSDGTSIVADAEHLWRTWTLKPQGHDDVWRTEQIATTLTRTSDGARNHSIPVAGALHCQPTALLVDPYVLGVWLGDGASGAGRVTNPDAEVWAGVADAGYALGTPQRSERKCLTHTVLGLQVSLRKMGVLADKHVPAQYLRASRLQRLHLLQGLMDTDGSISPVGQCCFDTTSPRLRDGFVELARSLGLKPLIEPRRAILDGRDMGPSWRIQFWAFGDLPVFRIRRKRERQREHPSRNARSATRQIVSVDPVPSVPVRCVQVDSPSNLYLAGEGMVPTHNTSMLAAYALYELVENDGAPEILLAAATDKQAGRLFDAAVRFVKSDPWLSARLVIREHEGQIAHAGTFGNLYRLSGDTGAAAGYNPSLVVVDELAEWTTPRRRRTWADVATAGELTREAARVFVISHAGEPHERVDGILGQVIDSNERDGELERVHRALTVSRDHASRTLVYNYCADTDDPHDLDAIRAANPASWIATERLAALARSPKLTPGRFLQLHGCVWASSAGAFLTLEEWRAVEVDERLDDGEQLTVGFRGGGGSWALVACRQRDGCLFTLAADSDGPADREAADAALQHAAASHRIAVVFAAATPEWRSLVDGWRGELGRKRVVDVRVDLPGPRTDQIVERFRADARAGVVRHAGDPRLAAAVLAAHVAVARGNAYLTVDVQHQAPIAAALAALLAWEAHAVTPPDSTPPGLRGNLSDYRIKPL
jgi:Phage Terminase